MSSVNKVIIIGNLGKTPDICTKTDGGKVATLLVATSQRWTDKRTGKKQEKTEWHRVTILNENFVNIAERYLSKNSKVYIEGHLQTRKWQDRDGTDRYITEIILQNFGGSLVLLSSNDSGEQQE